MNLNREELKTLVNFVELVSTYGAGNLSSGQQRERFETLLVVLGSQLPEAVNRVDLGTFVMTRQNVTEAAAPWSTEDVLVFLRRKINCTPLVERRIKG